MDSRPGFVVDSLTIAVFANNLENSVTTRFSPIMSWWRQASEYYFEKCSWLLRCVHVLLICVLISSWFFSSTTSSFRTWLWRSNLNNTCNNVRISTDSRLSHKIVILIKKVYTCLFQVHFPVLLSLHTFSESCQGGVMDFCGSKPWWHVNFNHNGGDCLMKNEIKEHCLIGHH